MQGAHGYAGAARGRMDALKLPCSPLGPSGALESAVVSAIYVAIHGQSVPHSMGGISIGRLQTARR